MTHHRRLFLKQLGLGSAALVATSWPLPTFAGPSVGKKLPRSTPEEQGVSSTAILGFLDAIARSQHEFHSFMVTRHGRVIAEGWWAPYRPSANHMLYSLSKSFTSTAVGLAVSEGRLKVDDSVTAFFPNELPATVSENLTALKVKHLLTMSVGHATDSTGFITKEENWVRAFLALPIASAPGSTFLYNSGATYMLSAIVQKLTGQKVIDYLRPRLFDPLHIESVTWETCPHGINTGGWGLSVPTEALAKFGQLYLQNGEWNGRQILPAAWVNEAATFKIQQPVGNVQDLEKAKLSSDWLQGYCYQFWRCRHNAFRGDGAFGQYDIIMRDHDAVVSITCETSDMQSELDLVWDHLLPAMKDGPLPADRDAHRELHRRLEALAIPQPEGKLILGAGEPISGKLFRVQASPNGAESFSFKFKKNACEFVLSDAKNSYPISCGLGNWIEGISNMPNTPPKITVGDLRPVKVAASGAWVDDKTFLMRWQYYETPHSVHVTCTFDGENAKVEFLNSITGKSSAHPEPNLVLHGVAA